MKLPRFFVWLLTGLADRTDSSCADDPSKLGGQPDGQWHAGVRESDQLKGVVISTHDAAKPGRMVHPLPLAPLPLRMGGARGRCGCRSWLSDLKSQISDQRTQHLPSPWSSRVAVCDKRLDGGLRLARRTGYNAHCASPIVVNERLRCAGAGGWWHRVAHGSRSDIHRSVRAEQVLVRPTSGRLHVRVSSRVRSSSRV